MSIVMCDDCEKRIDLDYEEAEEIKSSKICYDTPITDDVLGYLDNKTLNSTIEEVKKLKGDCND